jgi:hypothetical protein
MYDTCIIIDSFLKKSVAKTTALPLFSVFDATFSKSDKSGVKKEKKL